MSFYPEKSSHHEGVEVLVFGSISAEYINEVHFCNETALKAWQEKNSGTDSQRFSANEYYFRPRCDYKAWQN